MTKARKIAAAVGMLCCMPFSSIAGTEAPSGGLTVSALGTSTGGAFFTTLEAPAGAASRGCLWGLYYVDFTTFGGRAIYATLLSAQASGKKLARLDWTATGGSSGQCFASLVIVQD